jgi:hypothetical protein
MTTFRKITSWALNADHELTPGSTTTVHMKSGATKEVTVGEFIGERYGKFLYHVVSDNE